jgi:hypothetical protein
VVPPIMGIATYTGNGSTLAITGLGIEPGLVWTKRRTVSAASHAIYDYARGAGKYWRISSAAEVTDANSLASFGADGFTLGSATISNTSGASYVAWALAKGGSGTANTDGTIASTVSVNAAAGLSIFTYTGNGTAGATIGHGLGAEPEVVIINQLTSAYNVNVGGSLVGTDKYLYLSTNAQAATSNSFFRTQSSTTVTVGGAAGINQNGNSFVGYAFKSAAGRSSFGTYTGGGASDTTITTGFEPSLVIVKITSASGDWMMFDNVRGVDKQLIANSTAVESTVDKIAFTSTGFTVKANQNTNTGSASYLYLAFR